jgi:hypothetical protein
MNDITNADGLCPSYLVFGLIPTIPDVTRVHMRFYDRIRTMHTARLEYAKIVSEQRLKRALKRNVPSAADSEVTDGDMVYVWRENPKRWIGPLPVLFRKDKHIMIAVNGLPKAFNISQVKKAVLEDPTPSSEASTYITEIIHADNPRSSDFGPAIQKEISGLMETGTFKIVLKSEVETDANIIPSRMILAIKKGEDGSEVYKARLVLGGHRDKEKRALIHNSNNVSQTLSVCSLLWQPCSASTSLRPR